MVPVKRNKLPLKAKTAYKIPHSCKNKAQIVYIYSKPDILKALTNFNVVLQYLWKFTTRILDIMYTANGTLFI